MMIMIMMITNFGEGKVCDLNLAPLSTDFSKSRSSKPDQLQTNEKIIIILYTEGRNLNKQYLLLDY